MSALSAERRMQERRTVNHVEMIGWPCPIIRDVVDFEFAVDRHEFRLYGRKVNSYYFGFWMFVRKISARYQHILV